MPEKVYAWLLRLYPSHFRSAYGQEALQLLHDRKRDESGFLSSLRLWLDLLCDLAASLPREHQRVPLEPLSDSALLTFQGPRSCPLLRQAPRRVGAGVYNSEPIVFVQVLALELHKWYTVWVGSAGRPTTTGARPLESPRNPAQADHGKKGAPVKSPPHPSPHSPQVDSLQVQRTTICT